MVDSAQGKVALVTGGTRGIGAAIARRLLELGWTTWICGRTGPDVSVEGGGRTALFEACDVREPARVRALIEAIIARDGRLDLVVNNAGGSPPVAAATASPRFSEAVVALNLLAPLYVAQAAYPHLTASRGSIVNIASVGGRRPAPGTAIYGAAKAGLLGLSASLAQEWGPDVRVNAIIVGLIETEDAIWSYGSEGAQKRIAASLPLKRMGRGEDVAEAVAYLASPHAAYVSGAELAVHGGGERPLFLEIISEEAGGA